MTTQKVGSLDSWDTKAWGGGSGCRAQALGILVSPGSKVGGSEGLDPDGLQAPERVPPPSRALGPVNDIFELAVLNVSQLDSQCGGETGLGGGVPGQGSGEGWMEGDWSGARGNLEEEVGQAQGVRRDRLGVTTED